MADEEIICELVDQWLRIAHRDLLTAKQGFDAGIVITETICYHCQQAAGKALKAFLVRYQVEFSKTHNIITLLNLCSSVDASFQKLEKADDLTDYAVEIRYPDDWYEPSLEEANKAFQLAQKVVEFVKLKLN